MENDRDQGHRSPSRGRILVIEDERGLLDIISLNLEGSGYEVIKAVDGLQGWHAFDVQQPDLVVLDVNLPVISGFRLLELFRNSSRPDVPVVALTALDFAEAQELARLDLNAFLTKPFRPEELLETIDYLLRARRDLVSPDDTDPRRDISEEREG